MDQFPVFSFIELYLAISHKSFPSVADIARSEKVIQSKWEEMCALAKEISAPALWPHTNSNPQTIEIIEFQRRLTKPNDSFGRRKTIKREKIVVGIMVAIMTKA